MNDAQITISINMPDTWDDEEVEAFLDGVGEDVEWAVHDVPESVTVSVSYS